MLLTGLYTVEDLGDTLRDTLSDTLCSNPIIIIEKKYFQNQFMFFKDYTVYGFRKHFFIPVARLKKLFPTD